MYAALRVPLAVAFGAWCGVASAVWAASDTARPFPSAIVVAPEDTITYSLQDMGGQTVTATVPALASPQVKVSDRAQQAVQVTVLVIDGLHNQVTVQTQQGQTLMLTVPQEMVLGMRVGDEFLLQVAQRAVP